MEMFKNAGKVFSLELYDVDFDFVRRSENHYRIEFISSRKPGLCNGELALARVCSCADRENIILSLLPVADTRKNKLRLKSWYSRHGFISYDEGMIRIPLIYRTLLINASYGKFGGVNNG